MQTENTGREDEIVSPEVSEENERENSRELDRQETEQSRNERKCQQDEIREAELA